MVYSRVHFIQVVAQPAVDAEGPISYAGCAEVNSSLAGQADVGGIVGQVVAEGTRPALGSSGPACETRVLAEEAGVSAEKVLGGAVGTDGGVLTSEAALGTGKAGGVG